MMNEVIYLITEYDKEYDDDGFETEAEQRKIKCFASIKSVNYKEYYEAQAHNEMVTDIFVLDERDYNLGIYKTDEGKKIKPSLVEYDGTLYRIVRRYRRGTKANYTIELTCKEVE